MSKLMRRLAGLEDSGKNDFEDEEIKSEPRREKNSANGSVKFQITNGFIIFGLMLIWAVLYSFIRGIGIKLGWIPLLLTYLPFFVAYEYIVKRRKGGVKQNKVYAYPKTGMITKKRVIMVFFTIVFILSYWFLKQPDIEENVSLCNKIDTNFRKNDCLMDVAVKFNSEGVCEKINDGWDRDKCYEKVQKSLKK